MASPMSRFFPGNELPAFQTITPSDMDESMEGELAYIPDVVFTNGHVITAATPSATAAGRTASSTCAMTMNSLGRCCRRRSRPLRRGFPVYVRRGGRLPVASRGSGTSVHVRHQPEHASGPNQHHHHQLRSRVEHNVLGDSAAWSRAHSRLGMEVVDDMQVLEHQ